MKKVIVTSDRRVFQNLEEASREIGVAPATLSRALGDCRPVRGVKVKWADRVFAVRLKSDRWVIVAGNSGNGSLVRVDGVDGRISRRDVVQMRELTGVWYFPMEKWENFGSRVYAESGTDVDSGWR